MQYSFKALALLAVAGFALAQTDDGNGPLIDGIPQCAKQCLDDGASATTCSGPTDLACLCKPENQVLITNAAGGCVIKNCPKPLEVQDDAKALCASLSASTTAAAPETTASAEPATSSAEPVTTSEEAASSTEAASYPTSSAEAPTTTEVGTAAPTGSLPTSSLPPFTGAAAQAAAGVGSVFAAGLAVLAAF